MTFQASAISHPDIETARLILRAPGLDDVPQMARLANNQAVALMTGRLPFPYGETDALAFVNGQRQARREGRELAFVITARDSGGLMGCIGLRLPKPELAEIGYWLGQSHWQHGYATEAARALIDYGFNAFPHIAAIAGDCRVINEASRRVMEKCGLRYIDSGLRSAPARGGALPVDRFSLTREDWESFRAWQPATGGDTPST